MGNVVELIQKQPLTLEDAENQILEGQEMEFYGICLEADAWIEIKSGLYKESNYTTFPDYSKKEWDIAESTVRNKIKQAIVFRKGTPAARCGLIPTQTACLKIAKFPEDQWQEIYARAIEVAPKDQKELTSTDIVLLGRSVTGGEGRDGRMTRTQACPRSHDLIRGSCGFRGNED